MKSDAELDRLFKDHLVYELEMMLAMASGLGSPLFPQGYLRNALLESFVVHARNLIQFFYGESTNPDDALATDFFADPQQWLAARGDLPAVLEPIRKRANKEVAHLSYHRLKLQDDARNWIFGDIVSPIVATFEKFETMYSAARS